MLPSPAEYGAMVARVTQGWNVELTFEPVAWRQAILDSWPRALDDRRAREEWGWKPQYDLEAMTRDMVPKVRDLVAKGLLPKE